MNIPTRRKLTRTLLLSAMLLSVAAPLAAQEATNSDSLPPGTERTTVSPEAQAVIDRMTSYMKGLKTYSIESWSTRDEVVSFGYKLQHNEHSVTTAQLPTKLRADVDGDVRNRSFVYDGAKLVMYSPDDAVFVKVDAPDTVGKLVDGILDAGIEMPMLDMLYQTYNGRHHRRRPRRRAGGPDEDRRRGVRSPRVPVTELRLADLGGKRRPSAAAQAGDHHAL